MLNITDRTKEFITVFLWGELSRIKIREGDVIVINGGRVSSF